MGETELRKTVGADGQPITPAPSGTDVVPPPTGDTPPAPAKTPEEIEKEGQLANLDRAISQATDTLREIRKETRAARAGGGAPKPGDEDVPVIDDNDPSSKAWNGRIQETVAPLNAENEQAKDEVRSFALRKFLADKPALARNPAKVKELVGYYEKIRTASERTTEGVLLDLDKAYAVVYHQEILDAGRRGDIEAARTAGIISDIAVDRGATGYQNPKPTARKDLSADDRKVLAQWGIPEDEWQKDAAQFGT